jgi:hypothetical protein
MYVVSSIYAVHLWHDLIQDCYIRLQVASQARCLMTICGFCHNFEPLALQQGSYSLAEHGMIVGQ